MDTLVIVVRQIDRKDMFTHLFALLHSRTDITKLVKVEETRVPIIKVSLFSCSGRLDSSLYVCTDSSRWMVLSLTLRW